MDYHLICSFRSEEAKVFQYFHEFTLRLKMFERSILKIRNNDDLRNEKTKPKFFKVSS